MERRRKQCVCDGCGAVRCGAVRGRAGRAGSDWSVCTGAGSRNRQQAHVSGPRRPPEVPPANSSSLVVNGVGPAPMARRECSASRRAARSLPDWRVVCVLVCVLFYIDLFWVPLISWHGASFYFHQLFFSPGHVGRLIMLLTLILDQKFLVRNI